MAATLRSVHLHDPISAHTRTDFATLRQGMTVQEALAAIRQHGVGERQGVVLGAVACSDAGAIRHFQYHPQRHQRGTAATVANALQQCGQPAQCLSLPQRPGTPVVAFDHQHRLFQHRLAPA